MKTLITSPHGKEKLVSEFEKYGTITSVLDEDVKLIIPTADDELPFFADSKRWFEKRGIRVMVSDKYAIDMCHDKAEFYRFCRRHEFKTPRTMQTDIVVKPRFSKGSRGTAFYDKSRIIQERIRLPEVSIDYFADWDGKCLSVIPRYRKNVVNGESHDYEIVPEFNFNEVKRLGKELNLIGHNVIQGFWDGTEFIFLEVNNRFGGGSWMTWPIFNSVKWLAENSNLCLSQKKLSTT